MRREPCLWQPLWLAVVGARHTSKRIRCAHHTRPSMVASGGYSHMSPGHLSSASWTLFHWSSGMYASKSLVAAGWDLGSYLMARPESY